MKVCLKYDKSEIGNIQRIFVKERRIKMKRSKNMLEEMENLQEIQEIFSNDQKTVYSLKECLEKTKEKTLSFIYLNYALSENRKKQPSKKEMIESLHQNILEWFEEHLCNENKDKIKEKLLEEGKTQEFFLDYIISGFCYAFKEKGKDIYILPTELKEIWNKYKKLNSPLAMEKLEYKLSTYSLLNGVLPLEFIHQIAENNLIHVDDKTIKKVTNKIGLDTYKEKYFLAFQAPDKLIDNFIEIKEKYSYKLMTFDESEEYLEYLNMLYQNISKILKISIEEASFICLDHLVLEFAPVDDILERLEMKIPLDNKKKEKIRKFLEENLDDLRYWLYNGRTLQEHDFYGIISDMLMKKKPEKDSLKECIELLSLDGKDNLKYSYLLEDDTVPNLIKQIKKEFPEWMNLYDTNYALKIKNCHNKEIDDNFEEEDFLRGYIFVYQEENQIKTFLPKEIKEMLDTLDLEKRQEEAFKDIDINDFSEKDLIEGYLHINGVIEKNILKNILKEKHKIDITIKEMDKIIKEMEMEVKKDYYVIGSSLEKEDCEMILKSKQKFGKYQTLDFNVMFIEEAMLNELESYLNSIPLKEENFNDIMNFIVIPTKLGILTKEFLKSYLDDNNFSINESQKKKIVDIWKQYKNDISIWTYNGYTINEWNHESAKNKKIGRNDLCPCGSGKKYKKCCGQ